MRLLHTGTCTLVSQARLARVTGSIGRTGTWLVSGAVASCGFHLCYVTLGTCALGTVPVWPCRVQYSSTAGACLAEGLGGMGMV